MVKVEGRSDIARDVKVPGNLHGRAHDETTQFRDMDLQLSLGCSIGSACSSGKLDTTTCTLCDTQGLSRYHRNEYREETYKPRVLCHSPTYHEYQRLTILSLTWSSVIICQCKP